MNEIERSWTKAAITHLVGKKIVAARYLTRKEADELGWFRRTIVLELDDGNLIYPSMDDEGNDGGALFTNNPKLSVFPVIAQYLD